jgi:hypothetical protein
MAPNIRTSLNDELQAIESEKMTVKEGSQYKLQIRWRNVILFAALHLAALYGIYLLFFKAKWQTIVLSMFLLVIL